MPITETTVLGTSMGVLVGVTLFNVIYSIYMAVLNHRQAKVKNLVQKTNELLKDILDEIQLKKIDLVKK